jgi:hypothetical protein
VVVGCGTVTPGAAFTPESFSTRTIAVRAIPSPPDPTLACTTSAFAISRPCWASAARCGITTSARVHELQLGTEETGVLRGPAEQRRHAAEIDRRGNPRDAYRLSGLLGGECVRRQALSKAR